MNTGSYLAFYMKDDKGRCKPGYMTDGEIHAELSHGTDREAKLEAEIDQRRKGRRKARAATVMRDRVVSQCAMRGNVVGSAPSIPL